MFYLFLLISSLLTPSYGLNCDAGPISVPLKDTQVLPDVNGSYMIGLSTQVGSPPQDILMLPWAELNNTWIYDYEPYCDDTVLWNDLMCQVRRGNFFYENASSTYDEETSMVAAGGASNETNDEGAETGIPDLLSESLDGTDTIAVGSLNLTTFPLGIPRLEWDHGYTTLHALGLGSNSTFLNSLVQAGSIASRVWSIFWGRMWVDDWVDGSVVFGGYNSELVSGENHTQALDYSDDTGCWTGMKVVVSDIKLNSLNGEDVSIFPNNYALPACIVPHRQLLIEAPGDLRDTFESLTEMNYTGASYGLHWSAAQYSAIGAYGGDMTITLTSGFSVRVSNDQFLVPHIYVDYDGARKEDTSIKELLWNAVSDQSATLGRYFLTAAYLMVNHDSNSFTLWQANATTSSNLVPVMDEKSAEACGDVSGVVQPSATNSAKPAATASTLDNSRSSSGSTSVGAVVGGVVGGVAALALVALAAFFLARRRTRRARAQELSPGQGTSSDDITTKPEYIRGLETTERQHGEGPFELGGPKGPETHELPLNEGPREIGGREVTPAQAGDGLVHEMDGNVYTFTPERW
ncbi:hypothetical protein VPNG_09261 [Cytospora leucostoma]|uniref:Peptidase A1 domain-containing protein n=1 Tax=Cytospora leucostoma TaxID=1230097 RepID=A0A423W0M2_9PEZI|nr:hypothetical protein VPNG_09261 [Cytospora leucostoma]